MFTCCFLFKCIFSQQITCKNLPITLLNNSFTFSCFVNSLKSLKDIIWLWRIMKLLCVFWLKCINVWPDSSQKQKVKPIRQSGGKDDGTWHPDENISSDHCAERLSDLKHAHLNTNTIIFRPDRVIIAAVFNYSSHWASLGCTCVLCVWVRKILNYKSGQSYLWVWRGEREGGNKISSSSLLKMHRGSAHQFFTRFHYDMND